MAHQDALIQKRFGKLCVLSYAHSDIHNHTHWLCQCDCGKQKIINGRSLRRGMTKSCGCIGRSIGAENPHWLGYGGISLTKWNSLKKDAIKNRKIPFNISIEYAWELFLKQNRKCALTGLDITFSQTKRTSKMQCSASLDRIDSFLPYEEGNVQWVDKRVNFMKQRFPQDEFQRLCFLVSKHAGLVK